MLASRPSRSLLSGLAQQLEALPVLRLLGLVLSLPLIGFSLSHDLHVLRDYAECVSVPRDAAANHLPTLAFGYAKFHFGLHPLPVSQCARALASVSVTSCSRPR